MTWQKINNILEIQKGDLLRGTNNTYSQKYQLIEGYEMYNQSRTGRVISENHKSFFDVVILNSDNFEEVKLIYDCGTSGWWEVEKYVK